MNNLLDRLLMNPILDWIAYATIVVFSIAMLIAVFACFFWGVA